MVLTGDDEEGGAMQLQVYVDDVERSPGLMIMMLMKMMI
jgi:hypothetical protein